MGRLGLLALLSASRAPGRRLLKADLLSPLATSHNHQSLVKQQQPSDRSLNVSCRFTHLLVSVVKETRRTKAALAVGQAQPRFLAPPVPQSFPSFPFCRRHGKRGLHGRSLLLSIRLMLLSPSLSTPRTDDAPTTTTSSPFPSPSPYISFLSLFSPSLHQHHSAPKTSVSPAEMNGSESLVAQHFSPEAVSDTHFLLLLIPCSWNTA